MQEAVTFRPRGGHTATLGAGATSAVSIPAGTRHIHVVCSVNGGRIGCGAPDTAPPLADTAYGYLAANVGLTIKPAGERYLYLGSDAADNAFFITFGN